MRQRLSHMQVEMMGMDDSFRIAMSPFKYGSVSKPMTINFSGMNIYLPAILKLGRYQGFDP